ncbi:MAG: cation diffusion facilitator family transporter [Psittacicella sp.]
MQRYNKLVKKYTNLTLWLGFIVDIILGFFKVIIGTFSFNAALIADGVHSFADVVTDGVLLYFAKFWNAPPDRVHKYGHGKIETIASVFMGFFLLTIAIIITYEAVIAIINSSTITTNEVLVVIISVISILAKEFLYRSSSYYAEKINSQALKANALHHRTDSISSFVVIVAVICNLVFPTFHYFNEIGAIIIALILLKMSWDLVYTGILELTDISDNVIEAELLKMAIGNQDIKEIHKIRSRKLGGKILIDMHMLIDPNLSLRDAHDISERFKDKVMSVNSNIQDITIHIEPDIVSERYYH